MSAWILGHFEIHSFSDSRHFLSVKILKYWIRVSNQKKITQNYNTYYT